MNTPVVVLALPILLAGVARPARGQCELSTSPVAFGTTGAISGGHAILSDYETGLPPHVHFHAKTARGWQLEDTVVVGDQQVFVPVSVAIDGDRAIVGSPESNDLAGKVLVFDRVGDQWVPTELVSPTGGGTVEQFGSVVAIDGDVAVIGASHWGHAGGDGLARTHVFEFDGTSWSEVAQFQRYSETLDVDGDTIVLANDLAYLGEAVVYERVAGLWTLAARIQLPPPANGAYLGSSIAIQGDVFAVGASGHYGPAIGRVEIFRRQGAGWQHVQRIFASNSAAGDQFGHSVALSGSTLLVGAPHYWMTLPGEVHRFEHDGTGYVEAGRFGSETSPDRFGYRVALHREDAILAGPGTQSIYRLGFAHQTSFCPTTPNSTGSPGLLSVQGCDSLDGQRFTLVATGLPAGVLGVCFFGANTTQVPFGDGFRCVGAPFFRLPTGTTSASGRLIHDVDFSSSPASTITAGRTWHFQAYHRDPASTGADLNLTNALSIGITP